MKKCLITISLVVLVFWMCGIAVATPGGVKGPNPDAPGQQKDNPGSGGGLNPGNGGGQGHGIGNDGNPPGQGGVNPGNGGGHGNGVGQASASADQKQAQGQAQGQQQDQTAISSGNVQGQESSSTGNNTSLTFNSKYEEKTGVVQPTIPSLPWQMPTGQQINLWNGFYFDPRFVEDTWTIEEVTYILKHSGKWGTELGGGFDKLASFRKKYPAVSQIDLKVQQQGIDSYENLTKQGYKPIGVVNLKGDKDRNYLLSLAYALKLAMQGGGEVALLGGGMNHINHGSSFGLGVAPAFSSQNASTSIAAGINSGDAKVQAETAMVLLVLKKDGPKLVEGGTEAKPAEVVAAAPAEVNPQIIQQVSSGEAK